MFRVNYKNHVILFKCRHGKSCNIFNSYNSMKDPSIITCMYFNKLMMLSFQFKHINDTVNYINWNVKYANWLSYLQVLIRNSVSLSVVAVLLKWF